MNGVLVTGPLQVGDYTTSNAHDVSRRRTEQVVPGARRSPHLVVLQQVRINEHTPLGCQTQRRRLAVWQSQLTLSPADFIAQ